MALRLSDIRTDDMLNINNNFARFDGLKCPKNGKKRPAYLYPEVKTALLDLLDDSPHKDIPDPFFFYSGTPDKPCDCKVLLGGHREVLEKVGIDWKSRGITFHSLRHWYIYHANKEADAKKVMKVSGHLSDSVFQRYSAHADENDIREVGQLMGKIFTDIFSSKKVA